jgi:RNA polymerase sigma factor (sigma-70 family)
VGGGCQSSAREWPLPDMLFIARRADFGRAAASLVLADLMASTSTHASLFSRMRRPSDHAAWREFEAKYGDLILRYCVQRGLQHQDAEDVRQTVLMNLSRTLPRFKYDAARGSFRGYLGQTVRHAIAVFFARRRPNGPGKTVSIVGTDGAPLPAPSTDEDDVTWNQEWVRHHYRRALRTLRATHDPRSIEVFQRLLGGAGVRDVAGAFEMSEQAVHKVKQRVRDRLREIIARQLADEHPDNVHDG